MIQQTLRCDTLLTQWYYIHSCRQRYIHFPATLYTSITDYTIQFVTLP